MSKAKNKINPKRTQIKEIVSPIEANKERSLFDFLPTFRHRLIALLVLTFILFSNSIWNESALDDEIVLNKNQYVQNGIQGIGGILTHDAYSSYYDSMQANDQLSGGRYRPLSIVTFAIEESLFGYTEGSSITFSENGTTYSGILSRSLFDEKEVIVTQVNGVKILKRVNVKQIDGYATLYHLRHFVNVLFYLVTIGLLFYLLHFVLLPSYKDIAFLTILLFAIHPIHTEVVANVKSRDEILSLLFIGLTFIYAFKWRKNNKRNTLLLTCACYFLALLSKEWGIVLVALLPIAFVVFRKETFYQALKTSVPFFSVALLYILVRLSIVGMGSEQQQMDLLNNPYLNATAIEKFTTKTTVLLKYLQLQIFPYPLSSDYSFKTIAYRSLQSWDFWVSLLVHLGLVYVLLKLFLKKHILAFAIAFYLGPLFLVSNYIFDIGATMGERLVFHSSFGFCFLVAYLILKYSPKLGPLKRQKQLLFPLLILLIGLASFTTINRNSDWKNNTTLFIQDVQTVPNSILANGNAGKAYLELAEKENKGDNKQIDYLNKAEKYLNKAIQLDPKYYSAYLNLGYMWYMRNNLEKAALNWDAAASLFSRENHPLFWEKYDKSLAVAYYNRGLMAAQKKMYLEARKNLEMAVKYDPNNVQYLEDLGGACYTLNDKNTALEVWTIALTIDSTKANCRAGYSAITGKEWGQK